MVERSSPRDKVPDQADSSQLEILMFSLEGKDEAGRQTLYGINVFKVKEIVTLPRLYQKPNSHKFAAGMANIRGVAVPVVDLQEYYDYRKSNNQSILILTEFSGTTQGFIVHEVDRIIQLDWQNINQPPEMITELAGVNHGSTLTGISLLSDDEMLIVVDFEKIISEVLGNGIDVVEEATLQKSVSDLKVFFADDSLVARKQISRILDKMGIEYQCAKDGQQALEMLDVQAKAAAANGQSLSQSLHAIITDVEMPKMDGYMLTSKIKQDQRFNNIPVMMHSSISAEQSIRKGTEVGVDAYITKLQPKEFSEALNKLVTPGLSSAA
ncbi:hypothetical protein AB833_07830 [Chromatiales bacterium (ex Bugula neritina AB1)]|nr:hypothetical protein AB833_07830 [Chromatiales bacterium (ex Bugula neritina AB1)]